MILEEYGGGGADDPLILVAHRDPPAPSGDPTEESTSRSADQVVQEVAGRVAQAVPAPAWSPLRGDRSVLVEVVLGATGALVVLALVFGSLLAGGPLLVAAVSILGIYLALLVVTRWREERDTGVDNDTAVRRALDTAGRRVLFSEVTVAVSLSALILVPLPFLRNIGLGGLLVRCRQGGAAAPVGGHRPGRRAAGAGRSPRWARSPYPGSFLTAGRHPGAGGLPGCGPRQRRRTDRAAGGARDRRGSGGRQPGGGRRLRPGCVRRRRVGRPRGGSTAWAPSCCSDSPPPE